MRPLLLLTLDFPPKRGGVARYLQALAVNFASEIQVVAHPERGSEVVDQSAPFAIERTRLLSRWLYPHWLPAVSQLIRRRNDYQTAIVSHVLPLGTACWIARRAVRQPYIVIVHGLDLTLAKRDKRKRRLATQVLRGAKVVVANSHALAEEVRRDFGVEQTVVIYPSLLQPKPIRPVSHDGVVLLTVARLVARKGHIRVLQALATLRQEGMSTLTYRIVGDGPERRTLERVVRDLGLEAIVSFEGEVSDDQLNDLYASSDLFVMPTIQSEEDREGFGTVYLEAALAEIPSIATRSPGVDEAVIDGETGLLVPDGDQEGLVAAIRSLVSDEALRRRLGGQAQIRAVSDFRSDVQMNKLRAWL